MKFKYPPFIFLIYTFKFILEDKVALTTQQVRKNEFIEILPINVGCLGACTYCKTKHARGHLGSYTVESLVSSVTPTI